MKIKPMYTQVLVREIEASAATSGGILLPGKADETMQAEVLAVGHGRRGKDGTIIPLLVSVGDIILLESGNYIKVRGEEYILIKEDDILAIVEE